MSASPAASGPKGHWLTGVMPEFNRDPLSFIERCAREYGDVVPTRFFYVTAYFLNHPRDIEEVLVVRNKNFIKPGSLRTPFFRRIVGNGLLTSEGEFWRRQRRLVQPAFHRDRIDAYARIMTDYTERLMTQWRAGETRDLHADMMRLTMGIVTRALFSAEVGGDDAEEVGHALAEIARPFESQATLKWIIDNRLPTPAHRRFMRAVGKLDEVIYKLIRRRRESGEDAGDLLSMLLQARDETDNSGMTDRQLRDEVMTMFLAGQETTALALSWSWHLLMQNPETEARLHAELAGVLDGGREPALADLPRLRYTEAIIKESMRLYPPAWGVGRQALADCVIGGQRIPKNAQVFMMSWVVHRDPRFYDAPAEFRPERWMGEETKNLPKFAYFPFGGGPRGCIGSAFATMETILCLAAIARRFRFHPAPGHQVSLMPAMSLRPRDGIKVIVKRR
ncbi:MAG: cytochrome P450 [Pyrinomonadaceae bacterium]